MSNHRRDPQGRAARAAFERIPLALLLLLAACATQRLPDAPARADPPVDGRQAASAETLAEGQHVFRFETFGDEQFWTDTARMHEVVQKAVSPRTALSVGLKVMQPPYPPTWRRRSR